MLRDMRYVTVKEFAEALGVTRQAIHLRLEAGEIKHERFGRVRLIPESELSKWQRAKPKALGSAPRFIERVKKNKKSDL